MYEKRIIKPIKIVKRREGKRKSNRGGEFDQSILYACMEISQ
jgi:prenyltransferase beta subunit